MIIKTKWTRRGSTLVKCFMMSEDEGASERGREHRCLVQH